MQSVTPANCRNLISTAGTPLVWRGRQFNPVWQHHSSPLKLLDVASFYVSLYILGNHVRYFPDKWLADVDRATPLALIVEALLAQAEEDCPCWHLGDSAE